MCAPTIPEAPPPVGRPTKPSESAATNLRNPLALNLRRLRSQRGSLVNQVRRALIINDQNAPTQAVHQATVTSNAAAQRASAAPPPPSGGPALRAPSAGLGI